MFMNLMCHKSQCESFIWLFMNLSIKKKRSYVYFFFAYVFDFEQKKWNPVHLSSMNRGCSYITCKTKYYTATAFSR